MGENSHQDTHFSNEGEFQLHALGYIFVMCVESESSFMQINVSDIFEPNWLSSS